MSSVGIQVVGPSRALAPNAIGYIAKALNSLLADAFALYLKTKNFHWHITGPHFRDYHLLFDDQAAQLLALTDPLAERVRTLGEGTLRSAGHVVRLQRVVDNNAEHVAPRGMLSELSGDNIQLTVRLREAYQLCDECGDIATAALLSGWIQNAEERTRVLLDICNDLDSDE